MPSARFVVTGLKSIDRKLKLLPLRVQKKVVRQSMRAGLRVMQEAVKDEAPVDTGTLKGAVKVRAAKRRSRNNIEMEVVIKADDKLVKTSKAGQRTFYPAVVFYGSRKRNIGPNPFMRRAFTTRGEAARRVTLRLLRDGVEREAKAL